MKATMGEKQKPFLLEEQWYKAKVKSFSEQEGEYGVGLKFFFKILDDVELQEGEGTSKDKTVNGLQWATGHDAKGGIVMSPGSALAAWIQIMTEAIEEQAPSEEGDNIELDDLVGAIIEVQIENNTFTSKKGENKGEDVTMSNVVNVRGKDKKKASDLKKEAKKTGTSKKKEVVDEVDDTPKKPKASKKKEYPDFDEMDRNELKQYISDEGLQDNVVVKKSMSDEDIAAAIKEALGIVEEEEEKLPPPKKDKKKSNSYLAEEFEDLE